MKKIKFTKETFQNGMNLLIHQDCTHPIISVAVLYHVGSKDEDKGKKGFAHFFEHLMFEGTKNVKRGEFFKYIASNGGQNNAYTNHDQTYYYELLPSNKLDLALWLESERMFHAQVNQISIETQKKVVKEENSMRVKNIPYAKTISEIIPSLLFKKHPYRYPIIGFEKDINSSTEKDFLDFYDTYYVPNNATIAISGDLNINEAINLVHKYFDFIPKEMKNMDIKKKIIEQPIKEEIYSLIKDENVQIPAVFLSYRVPEMNHYDSYVLEMIHYILLLGESSRIVQNVVNSKQLASYVGPLSETMEEYGIFTIYGLPNPRVSLDELTSEFDQEIEKLKNQELTEYELEKYKNIIEKNLISENNSMNKINSKLLHYHVYFDDINLINTDIENYKKISVDDIKRIANQYLDKNSRVRLYNVPKFYK
ncbi:M16 family metallopeptidase [Blattabacterium cuenoti]|uniref:M16 family metallopeptidase n=1 Tax=Blattabacterium cuenoti TaxID=1653831 RepID=UPI001EEBA6EC|nr:pitrilysin family protein [Blattabacterium cuenoti]